MRTAGWMFRVPILLAVCLSGCTRGVAKANQSQVASALFAQFETVFYAKADLLAGSGGYKRLSEQSANTLRVPFADLLGALDPLGKQVSAEIFSDAEAVLVGAKDFHPPAGLGGVRSRSCYIVVFRGRRAFDIDSLASKSASISSAGASTWKWATKPTEGQPAGQVFYATQVAHSYLLIANNPDDLQTTAATLASTNNAQMLNGVHDWESISKRDVWGYRRYRQTEVTHRDAAGMTDVTPTAEALVFFLDSKEKAGVLRLVASDGSTAEKINAAKKLPSLKLLRAGIWETRIPLSGSEAPSEEMLGTLWLFGFGLYL